jgi:3-phenylpropionate/cinnamic acid dioxygenase small subunit
MSYSLQELADRVEIDQLLARYCHALDEHDWDSFRGVFTEDAIHDDTVAGGFRGGVDAKIEFLQHALSKVLISQHIVSTTLLELDGDQAEARSVCQCPMVLDLGEGKTHVFFQGLWYDDKLVRTPAGWRISERVERDYYSHNFPEGFTFQD